MSFLSRTRQQFHYLIHSTFNAASSAPANYQISGNLIDLRVQSKSNLLNLAKDLGLTGKGVEIGVKFGKFSEIILSQSNLSTLYSIDPWKEFSLEEYYDGSNTNQQEQNKRYQLAINRLSKFKQRSIIIRKTSKDASIEFCNDELDFIFIDGNHSYESVKEDLDLWWSKVRVGGLFSGDDYLFTPKQKTPVKDAVDEFMQTMNQKFYLTKNKFPCWYCIKGL